MSYKPYETKIHEGILLLNHEIRRPLCNISAIAKMIRSEKISLVELSELINLLIMSLEEFDQEMTKHHIFDNSGLIEKQPE